MSIWDSLFGKKAGKKRPAQTPPTRSKREIGSEWMIGDLIENRYEIQQILEGGMGIVYICYDLQYHVPYALKTFKNSYLLSEQMKARFIREAETWIALEKHQNIVKAGFVQKIQGKPYIALEYIANPAMGGASLERWIKRGMDVPQALNFAVQFCDGMDYAHKKTGIVHRDIKPGNILVTQNQIVKITDFGLVTTMATESLQEDFLETVREEKVSNNVSFTRTGAVIGTPPYMSPEQCRNAQKLDIRSDIYAFGAVLYEMLTGRWIFQASTVAGFLHCHLHDPPLPPSSLISTLPQNLENIVLRCLAKAPEARYSDFGMLRMELAEIYYGVTGKQLLPPAKEVLDVRDWCNKGFSLFSLGREEEAISCYEQALKIDPDDVFTLNNKGLACSNLGFDEEALNCYNHALNVEPTFFEAWSNKGSSLVKLRRYEEALASYEHALTLEPKFAQAWNGKGGALTKLGRPDEALTCFDQALALNPEDALAWHNKGTFLFMLGRYAETLPCFEHALTLNPQLAQAWYNKGFSLKMLEHHEEAVDCFEHALKITPNYSGVWWVAKGDSLAKLGRLEEALACYEDALALNPHLAPAWISKGAIFGNARRFQEALECFYKALEIDPYNENAKRNIAFCQQFLK